MLEYEEHTSENDQHTVRLVKYNCGDPTCKGCAEDEYETEAILFNSVRFDQHRWLATGLVDERDKEAFLESFEQDVTQDFYARLACVFGLSWDVFEKDLHLAMDLCKDRLTPVIGEEKFTHALRNLDSKYLKFFSVPETEPAKRAVDRVKTLLAFPQIYKPKKKKKKADGKQPDKKQSDN